MSKSELTRSAYDIARKALSLLRVIDPQIPLDPHVGETAFDALNDLIKHLQNEGFHLWTEREAIMPLVEDRQRYILGPDGDNCADVDNFQFLSTVNYSNNKVLNVIGNINGASNLISDSPTESTQDWAATDSTITSDGESLTVTNSIASQGSASYSVETTPGETYVFAFKYEKGSSTGANISASDINGDIEQIILTLDSQTTIEFTARQNATNFVIQNQSSTVGHTNSVSMLNYVNASDGDKIGVLLKDRSFFWTNVVFYENNRATLADRLPEQIEPNTKVYSYTEILDKPMSITNIRFRENMGFSDIPTTEWARREYFEQTNKDSKGTLTKWYYSRQLENVELYVWQTASSGEQLAYISYIRPTNINTSNADSIDFPAEWFKALYYMLARDLLPEFSVPDQRSAEIAMMANQFEDMALGFDNGDTYIAFYPDHVNR